jgi:F-type H+-transporting ATPase subunit O
MAGRRCEFKLLTSVLLLQYTAAAKTAALDPTARALDSLGRLLKRDAKLPRILSAPSLTVEDKKAIIVELQKHSGGGGEVIKNFLNTLAENNRLGALEGVCDKFAELMSAHRGEVELVVTSAAVRAPDELPGPN